MLRTLGVVLFSVISVSSRVAGTRQAPDLCHRPSQNDCPLPEKRKLTKKNVHLFYKSPPQNIRVTHEKWHSFLIYIYFHSSFFTTPKTSQFKILRICLGNWLIRISTGQPTVLSDVSAIFFTLHRKIAAHFRIYFTITLHHPLFSEPLKSR